VAVVRGAAWDLRLPRGGHRRIRYLDKLVDELAKGRAMEKILRA
jgi:hypothetical protein